MTICIAAIGKHNSSECIVFSTDHMLSQLNLGQFEHAIDKYKLVNKCTIAMFSGTTTFFPEIIKRIKPDLTDFDEIAEDIRRAMSEFREEKIEREILGPYKIDWQFVKDNLDKPFQNRVIEGMMVTIGQSNLQSSILLVGFKNGEAQSAEVNEFRVNKFRDITFSAIGSGAVQALNALLFQKRTIDDDLSKTIYDVYKAKRNAEVSIGVGRETEIGILFADCKVEELNEKQKQVLAEIYKQEQEVAKKSKALGELSKTWKMS